MKFAHVIFAAALLAAPVVTAFAHGPSVGPHGGPMADAGAHHTELVIQGNEIVLYITDGDGKAADATGAKAEATVLADKQAQKVTMTPAGGNIMKGTANLGDAHDGVKVVTVLTMPGQKPAQVRFEMMRAGH